MNALLIIGILISWMPWMTQAQLDPSLSWRVIETDHFEVIYSTSYKELAQIYAYEAERSYADLKPVFGEVTEKTIVVIVDNTDLTNGYANFLPYPHMVLFPVLPGDLSTINYFDNWARDLMIHEYTHILSFQPSNGFYTPLRWIFGTIIRPNAILPRWFLEGVAVQVESRYTAKGRLKNPATMGVLRAMVKDGTLLKNSIDKINETSIPTYPFGRRPYLFGSLLWQEMLEGAKPGLVERLHQRHSRRLPFLLNTPIKEETGRTYSQLLDDRYQKIIEKATRQLRYLKSAGDFDGELLGAIKGDSHVSPKISPNGQHLVFINYEAKNGAHVQVLSKAKDTSSSFRGIEGKNLFASSGTQRFDWFPDSKKFVYEKVGRWKRYYYFSDLYVYDMEKKKSERITHGARAREAAVSPDSTRVAFVSLEGARTSLSILNLETKSLSTIFHPSSFNRISSPVWLDHNKLAFVGRSKKRGLQSLYFFNLNEDRTKSTGKPQRLLSKFQHVSQPVLTDAGILFVSHDSGVANLFLAPKPYDRGWAVSNSLTHILNGDRDPHSKDIVFSQSTGSGPKLYILRNQKPVRLKRLKKAAADGLKPLGPVSQLNAKSLKMEDESFWGIEYLLPQYWIPFIFPVEGGAIFQGSVAANDPLNINSWYLNGSFDTVTDKVSYGVGYYNQSTPVGLGLDYAEFQNFLPGTSLVLTNRFSAASTSFFLPWLSYKWRGYLSYVYDETETEFEVLKGAGPSAGFSYAGSDQDVNATDTTKGSSLISVAHTEYLEQDNYYKFGRTRAHLYKSSNLFFPKTHSLGLHVKGSHSPLMRSADIIELGDKTIGGNYLVNIINSSYIMRGYPTGAFVGKTLVNTNLEYKFPLNDIYKANGLFPLFFNNVTSTIFVDGVTVDGGYLDINLENYRASEIEDSFWSTGIEFNINTTMAYHLPVTFTLGLYYGFTEKAGGGFSPFISLGYTGHDGVDSNKSPHSQKH